VIPSTRQPSFSHERRRALWSTEARLAFCASWQVALAQTASESEAARAPLLPPEQLGALANSAPRASEAAYS